MVLPPIIVEGVYKRPNMEVSLEVRRRPMDKPYTGLYQTTFIGIEHKKPIKRVNRFSTARETQEMIDSVLIMGYILQPEPFSLTAWLETPCPLSDAKNPENNP